MAGENNSFPPGVSDGPGVCGRLRLPSRFCFAMILSPAVPPTMGLLNGKVLPFLAVAAVVRRHCEGFFAAVPSIAP